MNGGTLIVVALGPVQDFIAAARRSRDLWFGSTLLSEASKAAAGSLRGQGCELLFPAPEDEARDLDLRPPAARPGAFNVSNKVMAWIPADRDLAPVDVARLAQEAAAVRVRAYAEHTLGLARGHGLKVREAVFRGQLPDLLETYAAWVRLGPGRDAYRAGLRRLEALLAGRKAARDFKPAVCPVPGLPKSSLDGARETVLERSQRPQALRRAGVADGEELDAIGLTKRLAGEPGQFAPISRVALVPFLEGLRKVDADRRGDVEAAEEDLLRHLDERDPAAPDRRVATEWFSRVEARRYEHLPWDGEMLLEGQAEARREAGVVRGGGVPMTQQQEGWLRALSRKARVLVDANGLGWPEPYVALLQADGDRMGETISGLPDPARHRALSKALAGFAKTARNVVEEECRGSLIYSGGDDVLAFLPLHTALRAARGLHQAFAAAFDGLGIEGGPPTLSAGIAIVHCLEPLGELRALARRAEEIAKGRDLGDGARGDGLAIVLSPRSGAPYQVRGKWSAGIDGRIARFVGWEVEGAMSTRTAYGLRRLAREARDYSWDADLVRSEARAEITERARRSGRGGSAEDAPALVLGRDLDALLASHSRPAAALAELADEMVIAARLASTVRQARAGHLEGHAPPAAAQERKTR